MIRAAALAMLSTLSLPAAVAATGTVEVTPRDQLRADLAGMIAPCWAVDSLSPSARATVVTIAVEMTPEGLPRAETIRLLRAHGDGEAADVQQAFEAARRAILRCAEDGYALPAELHPLWREVEMTFDANEHLM
jgi:hypothetical protein